MYKCGERTISKREEVYHEIESRMRVHYGTRMWKCTMGQKERGYLLYGTEKMKVQYKTERTRAHYETEETVPLIFHLHGSRSVISM